ncbi:hypothetical protein ScPMuIL_013685 [Solemya velum]
MAAPRKKITTQDDLRNLMRGKQFEAKLKNDKKIEHPLAKYNSLDQLVCVLSQREILYIEIINRIEKYSTWCEKKKDSNGTLQSKKPREDKETKKSSIPSDFFESSSKKPASSSAMGKEPLKKSVLAEYSSSSEDEEELELSKQSGASTSESTSKLPPDFFDEGGAVPETKSQTISDALPEGFFDDPKKDAKVRKVEYRDKMDDEWELFQRAMKEETHVSEAIMAEEDEQVTVDRNIDEIDDQIQRWKEINDLQVKKDKIMENKPEKSEKDSLDSDEDLDENELEEFLNWRSKKSCKL